MVDRALRAGTPAREALQGAVTAIAASGADTPRLDAELLLAHVLGVGRERLLIDRGLTVAGPAVRAFQEAVRRRAVEREPVAYIIGRRDFRALALRVDHRVLVPRPETELLVEVAVAELARGASVLDLGTGSGAIALALKHERPDLDVAGSDVSEPALELARSNGRRLGLAVRWLQADMLRGIGDEFDAVVSNPPYVSELESAQLAPEIRDHEPPRALFAGADGLSSIRALVAQSGERTRLALLALEVGVGQAAAVRELVAQAGFGHVRSERDLAAIERVVVARRAAGGAG
ncbi:MAG TPA: peptide chain release factor N(5)-glutamine methyltransferase [Solirubrobacteraceae bacterium]|nr:peptide chain release factor N(5)-glutamine methyltransferase [Solirubrobacteraceae bacterium]